MVVNTLPQRVFYCLPGFALLLLLSLNIASNASSPGLDQAVANYRAGRYSQALVQLESLNQSDPLVHYYMGLCYHNLNQVSRALQEYQWVAQAARDPALRQNAQLGMQQLSQYQSHRTYAGQGNVYHGSASSAASSGYGGRPKVIDFFATWCGPCKELAPRLEAIESQYRGRVDFERIDIDQNESMKDQYRVHAVPTLVFIDGHGKVVDRLEGGPPNMVLTQEIERLLSR